MENVSTTSNIDIDAAKSITMVHIILPFLFTTILLFIMLYNKLVTCNRFLPLKIHLPPLAELHHTIIECRFLVNKKNIKDPNYERRKTYLSKQLEDQKTSITISMILEASLKTSFAFFFQGLFSLPTLVFAFNDVYDGEIWITDLVDWKIVSIVTSFLSFAKQSQSILRNSVKNEAFRANYFVVFFGKVLFDAISKLILFGTWMLTFTNWKLSLNLIVAFYYGMVLLFMIANIGFCLIEKEQIVSLRNMIGNYFVFCIKYKYHLEFKIQNTKSKDLYIVKPNPSPQSPVPTGPKS